MEKSHERTRSTDLRGKVALVTGGSRGIGWAIAGGLGRAGASVILAAREGKALEEAAERLRADGVQARGIPADVGREADVTRLFDETLASGGRIDVLVNNAGASYVSNLILADDDRWWAAFEVNVRSTYLCTKAALRPMIRARSGRVVNIASISGVVGAAYNSSYAASKAAVIGFTKSISREVAGLGITVNAVCPWHVDTGMSRETMAARGRMVGKPASAYLRELAEESPRRSLVRPEEVAALAVFLCSPAASGLTGLALNVSGGAILT